MNPLDAQSSKVWAIAGLASGGLIVNFNQFDLVNRISGRAHQMSITTGGVATPLPLASTGPVSYTSFETTSVVTFADFDGVGARITSVNAGVFYGYCVTWLTLWEGVAYHSPLLAQVVLTGLGVMLAPGASTGHGVTKILDGVGVPVAKPPLILVDDDSFPDEPRHVQWRIIPHAKQILAPGDMLFDFDRDVLKPDAIAALKEIEAYLNLRVTSHVEIAGYTDSIGSESYNTKLSMRRANAVREWLIKAKVNGAEKFKLVPQGAADPVAPNRIMGRDNPLGRAQNRRVEITYN